jgi:hypothetical protein
MRIAASLIVAWSFSCGSGYAQDRVRLKLDTSEADAAIAILKARAANRDPSAADWQRLFSSRPYQVLKRREESVNNSFTDDDFKRFLSSPALIDQREALQATLEEWSHVDLAAAAERLLGYLPLSAVIESEIFPVIKPQKNSFVFHPDAGAVVFLSLDSAESAAHFQNKVVHELHHIGLDSFENQYEQRIAALPDGPQRAARWMGSFGEGLAMLAAAGGPDVHPLAAGTPAERERWDRDMARFNSDLRAIDQFLLDTAQGRLKGDAVIERGQSFYGTQGPWYTVGYKMAVTVENKFGRDELIRCMEDPRRLLAMFNKAAASNNGGADVHLELWSPALLSAVKAPRV